MVQNSHDQLICVKRDVRLLRLCDVVLDAPEDKGLKRPVAGIVCLEKEPQDLTLQTQGKSLKARLHKVISPLTFVTLGMRQRSEKERGRERKRERAGGGQASGEKGG